MAGIRLEGLKKSYGELTVLADFSLDVADGEFVVLVGPSGCGKSTVLKILAGLEPASAGRVLIGERDVTDLAPGDRDVAMVFQNYALYPHMSVARNLGFGLRMRGTPAAEIERRVNDAARILGIDHLLARRPRQLSGGQRQRVALGRAIVREPQAFLMDEPLSNLDAALRVHTRAEIAALHARLGVTTLYVTHDQTEAMTMASRIVVMRDGAVQQIADPATTYRRPANLFVAGFIGSPGMNMLAATSEGGAAKLFGQRIALPAAGEAGRTLVVGLRPEHLAAGVGPVTFEAEARLVESLGAETYVYFDVPAENRLAPGRGLVEDGRRADRLVARLLDGETVRAGERITLSFDPARLHLFDAATGAAISSDAR